MQRLIALKVKDRSRQKSRHSQPIRLKLCHKQALKGLRTIDSLGTGTIDALLQDFERIRGATLQVHDVLCK